MMNEQQQTAVPLGTGVLNWNRSERITDRYGAVILTTGFMTDPLDSDLDDNALVVPPDLVGRRGDLVATVVETRLSPHIGDLYAQHSPRQDGPVVVGETLTLGTGTLFTDDHERGYLVGLRPSDGRRANWLDPKTLYRLHNQTVALAFVPFVAEVTAESES